MSAPTFLFDRIAGRGGAARLTVVNMGRASSFLMDAYYYLIAIRKYRPDIIIFYAGMNDRYDYGPEPCLPENHPRVHAAWRWLVERSGLLSYLRIMGPRRMLAFRPTPPSGGGRDRGRNRCEPDSAYKGWIAILMETAAATGARVIVTSPVENALKQIDYENADGKAGLSLDEFFARLDPEYRSLLRCLMRPEGDLPAALREAARRHGGEAELRRDLRFKQELWRCAASRFGAGFVDLPGLLEARGPGGLPGPPLIVDEVHLSPEGYWLLSGLWQEKLSELLPDVPPPGARDLAGLDLRRYRAQATFPMGDVLVFQGLIYLKNKLPLLAFQILKLAAERHHSERAARVVRWLRVQAGAEAAPAAEAGTAGLLAPGDLSPEPPRAALSGRP